MRDLLTELAALAEPFAVATVVRTWSSAPRTPGASLAVTADHRAIGSVSGGCVEAAVFDAGCEVLATGTPQLLSFGVTDDDAFAVGLTCGGSIELVVTRVDPSAGLVTALAEAVERRRPAALATVTAGPPTVVGMQVLALAGTHMGGTGDQALDDAILAAARKLLAERRSGLVEVEASGQCNPVTVFVESCAPPPHLVVFGAIDFAAALVRVGSFLGFHVTVCDARPVFATQDRLPDADEIVVTWPHEYLRTLEVDASTMLCVLTHDFKFDVPLLQAALDTPAGYIGVMGSRSTHERRTAELRARGVTEEQLARLRSPIGLDLGGRSPEETAISIAAEIIAARHGGSGLPLSALSAPIHAADPPAAVRVG